MCGTLNCYKRKNFPRQTFSQFLVFSAKIYMSATFFKICHRQKFMLVKFFKTCHRRNFKCCKVLKIFPNIVRNCSSYVIIFNFQICILCCLSTAYPPSHQHNGCMENCALGHTFVRLHVTGIQKGLCIYLQKNTKAIWCKQKSCQFYHGTISGLHKSIPSFFNFSIFKSGHQQNIVSAKNLKLGHL